MSLITAYELDSSTVAFASCSMNSFLFTYKFQSSYVSRPFTMYIMHPPENIFMLAAILHDHKSRVHHVFPLSFITLLPSFRFKSISLRTSLTSPMLRNNRPIENAFLTSASQLAGLTLDRNSWCWMATVVFVTYQITHTFLVFQNREW